MSELSSIVIRAGPVLYRGKELHCLLSDFLHERKREMPVSQGGGAVSMFVFYLLVM